MTTKNPVVINGPKRKPKLARLQVNLTQQDLSDVDEILMLMGFSSKREVVVHALAIYKWALTQKQLRNNIAAILPSGERIFFEMPGLNVPKR